MTEPQPHQTSSDEITAAADMPRRGRGGPRPGAGRPPVEGKRLECLVPVRMSTRQKNAFRTLGGSRWLREKLNEAITSDLETPQIDEAASLPQTSSALFLPQEKVHAESARWGALLAPAQGGSHPVTDINALRAERFLALRTAAELLADAGRAGAAIKSEGPHEADGNEVLLIVETQGEDVRAVKNILTAGSSAPASYPLPHGPFIARTTTGFLAGSVQALLDASRSRALDVLGGVRAVCTLRTT